MANTYAYYEVVGIAADADTYHLKCAEAQYSKLAINTVKLAEELGASDDFIIAAFMAEEWPADREGNPIRAIVAGNSNDRRDDDLLYGHPLDENRYPAVCGKCLDYIAAVDDLRAHGVALDDGATQLA